MQLIIQQMCQAFYVNFPVFILYSHNKNYNMHFAKSVSKKKMYIHVHILMRIRTCVNLYLR